MAEHIQSMTGYARTERMTARARISWEIKSVNGKSLDIRLRLPQGLDRLELPLKDEAKTHLQRGSLQAGLTVETIARDEALTLDETRLEAVIALSERLAKRITLAPSTLEGLLSIPGVMTGRVAEAAGSDEDDGEIIEGFREALAALVAARREEGQRVAAVLKGQLDAIERITDTAARDPALAPEAIAAKLAEQVGRLANTTLDPERLHAEAALIAVKADIREEVDRLAIHVAQGRDLIARGGAIGRRLDFLAQEFNREANTLCSKANAPSITACGMELKVVIDQLREQVQNLE